MGGPHTPEALKAARREAGKVVDTVCFDKGWGFRDALIEAIAPLILLKDASLAALQQVTAERDEARVIAEQHQGSALDAEYWQEEAARLRAEGEAKDRALKPFAEFAELVARQYPGWDHDGFLIAHGGDWALHMSPFRAARAATAREGA